MSYDSCLEADKYFEELARNKDTLQKTWDLITRTVNESLPLKDYDHLLSLIPYIEEGNGSLAFQHIGESRRLLRILHIIELERKYQEPSFPTNCSTLDELVEKYMLTLFALRRLQFSPSEAAVSDAVVYLTQNRLSVFAIYIIIQQDLIIPDSTLYQKIIELYAGEWSQPDLTLFSSLILPE